MLQRLLEKENYKVFETPDGNECVRLCRTESIDLIITDIIMPDMEGIELISLIRGEFPDIKIIAISGGGQIEPQSYLTLAEKLGADRTFSKPFKLDEIVAAVNSTLGT